MVTVMIPTTQTPKLTPVERAKLVSVVNKTIQNRGNFVISVTYTKQTDKEPRQPGEHYLPLPGVAKHAHLGPIKKIDLTNDGNWYLNLMDFARFPNDRDIGYSSLRFTGLTSFTVISQESR